jgi:hypothetical protein
LRSTTPKRYGVLLITDLQKLYDIKTFGGLKKYYAPYMKKLSREVQTTSREANEKK